MRYYSTLRPIDLGTVPKNFTSYKNFDTRKYVDSIGHEAWGWVEYDKELTKDEMDAYELMKEDDNMLTEKEFYEQAKERAINSGGCIKARIDPETLELRGEYDVFPVYPDFGIGYVKPEESYDAYKKVCEEIKKMKYVGYAYDITVYGKTREDVANELKYVSNGSEYEVRAWQN